MRTSLKNHDLARRSFIKRCASSAFCVSMLPEALHAASNGTDQSLGNGFGKAKHVIFIMVSGGLTQVDTLDPKPGVPTPGKIIPNSAGGQFTSYIPNIAKVADRMCVIRSMTGEIGIHSSARYFMRTAYKESAQMNHPMIGAYAHEILGPSHDVLPSTVSINRTAGFGNGFLPSSTSPLPILDPGAGLQHSQASGGLEELERRISILDQLDRQFREAHPDRNIAAYTDFYEDSIRLMAGKDVDAFDLRKEPKMMREAYGSSKLGQGCLLARRLVESGVRFVEVESRGWDFHNNLEDRIAELAPGFDQAVSQLILDLEQRGLLQETLIVVTTEFGRSPKGSGSGRKHFPSAFSVALAGAGIKGGSTYGKTSDDGLHIVEGKATAGDLHATIGFAMGVRPGTEVKSDNGRPFRIGNLGKPILSIMS